MPGRRPDRAPKADSPLMKVPDPVESPAAADAPSDPDASRAPSPTGYDHAWTDLNLPEPALATDRGRPLSRLMYAIWQTRTDLQQAFPLERRAGRNAFVQWFLTYGRQEYRLPPGLIPAFREPAGDTAAAPAPPEPPGRPARLAGLRRALVAWLHRTGRKTLTASCETTSDEAPLDPLPVQSPVVTRTPVPPARARPKGANLIGYARGELGIGEDLRTTAHALATAGLPFVVRDFKENLATRCEDRSVEHWLSAEQPYRANLLCMTGFEVRTAFFALGPEAFDGRYNIGLWPWELPHWPAAWRQAFWFVDEVWTPSSFVRDAIAEVAPVPVRCLPPAVTVPDAPAASRAEFGLAEDACLFLFAFDGNSFIARKNPFACIEAFRRAFPRGDEAAGLVIKAMNVRDDDAAWRRLRAMAAADARITIRAETLSRGAMLGLISVCDAFVSLHRAEGFGRGPAEAMALGKPVVVTNYSGNTDFCTPETAFLVDCSPRPLEAGEYPFWQGQTWAEPDVDHAAALLRRVAEHPEEARRKGQAARDFLRRRHGAEAAGRRYAARLREIGLA